MTFEEFRQIASPKTIIPVFERFNGDFVTPVMVYLKMRQPGHHSFLLESVLKGEHLGRYSFIGFSPFHLLKDTGTGIMETGSGEENTSGKTSFFERLSELLSQYTPVHREGLPGLPVAQWDLSDTKWSGNMKCFQLLKGIPSEQTMH